MVEITKEINGLGVRNGVEYDDLLYRWSQDRDLDPNSLAICHGICYNKNVEEVYITLE